MEVYDTFQLGSIVSSDLVLLTLNFRQMIEFDHLLMMWLGGGSFLQNLISIYTVSHKKRATLFLIITLAFLGRFLYFLHQWKEEG